MFNKNFPTLIEKGIEVRPLLDSHVFTYDFDFDEWPSTHNNPETYLRPFNENLFQIRKFYRTVFPESEFASLDDQELELKDKNIDSSKIYKIKYTLNMLPFVGVYMNKIYDIRKGPDHPPTLELANEDVNILAICAESDEIEMFETESLQDLIEFKWNAFARNWHMFGFTIHFVYIFFLFSYTNIVYIQGFSVQDEDQSEST